MAIEPRLLRRRRQRRRTLVRAQFIQWIVAAADSSARAKKLASGWPIWHKFSEELILQTNTEQIKLG